MNWSLKEIYKALEINKRSEQKLFLKNFQLTVEI